MTSALVTAPVSSEVTAPRTGLADRLVIGSCVVAPLNLLVVRSFTVYDALVAVAFLLLALGGRLRWPARRYLAMSYLFVVVALLSSFRALYPTEALTQVLQYLFVFFVQIPAVLAVVRTRRRAVVCIALLCAGTLGAMLHAYLFPQTQGAGRSLVFYSDNPNRLGYPAAYVLPFVLALWHLSRGTRPAVRATVLLACAGSAYLALWAVFASGSRSSLLGSAAAMVVFVVLRPDLSLLGKVGRGTALAAAVAVLGAGLMSTGQLPSTLEERVNRSMTAEIDDRAGLVGDREHLARAGMLAFVESPYLGTGLDNFRHVTVNYDLDATPQLPHNLWLQLGVQVGVVGAAAMAALLLLWGIDLLRAVRRATPPDREVLWSTAAAMAGILTIFMFSPEMLDRHYWLIFALGLAAAAGVLRDTEPGGTS